MRLTAAWRTVALASSLLGATVLASPTAAHANTALDWSKPASMYGARPAQAPSAVACPSSGLCVAVDGSGEALSSLNPTAASPTWRIATVDPGHALTGVSCVSESLCVAVDDAGDVLTSTDPSAAVWQSRSVSSAGFTGVSCPTTTLCLLVDQVGELSSSVDPGAGVSASWTPPVPIDEGVRLNAISCASATSCVTVDEAGQALASSTPGVAGSWHARPVDASGALRTVSCSYPDRCLASDGTGQALISNDVSDPAPTWSATPVDSLGEPAGVSCVAGEQCVLVDRAGQALISDDPGTIPPLWSATPADPGVALEAIACVQGAFCLALDAQGRSVSTPLARLPSPAAPTPSNVAIVRPSPSIVGIPAVGERLRCLSGIPEGGEVQLTYTWVRDAIPVAGSSSPSYKVAPADAQHHLQCQVTATDTAGSATAHSAFVAIPAQGVLAALGETSVGRLKLTSHGASVTIACSPEAPHGCSTQMRLSAVESVRDGRVLSISTHAPASKSGARKLSVSLGSRSVHVGTGRKASVSVSLNAAAMRLLRRLHRLPALLTVQGTVIGVLQAQLLRREVAFSGSAKASSALLARVKADALPSVPEALLSVPDALPSVPGARAASKPVLAPTPYMGWDTYFAFGGRYSEASVLQQASQLIVFGLRAKGYRYVWLDAGWWHGKRGRHGEIAVNHSQWPHGMAWLARTLHAAGFRVGLYTDAGREGCGGAHQGSYGHYRQDVDTFAAWGFDAVKVDFCGGVRAHLDPDTAYSAIHEAIEADKPHRPMLLSICNFLEPGQLSGSPNFAQSAFSSYTFGPSVGNSWRTDTDVGSPDYVTFPTVLRNLDADAAHPEAAGPGHWNDPDYLGPDQGMTAGQFDTQFSMWAMLAAPLMVSDNLMHASHEAIAALSNSEVIAIDQDPAGVQGKLLSSSEAGQVWVKPLSDGSRAVALLNRGSQPEVLETSSAAVGLPSASSYQVRNVWSHTASTTSGSIAALVGGESTVLLKVSAGDAG